MSKANTLFDLNGKVALVTGANRGLGLGMAKALAVAGADLVVWGTNSERNEEARAVLAPLCQSLLVANVDVSDEVQVIRGMAQAAETFGRVDTVIANAGVGSIPQPFHELSTAEYRRVLAVNLDGLIWTFREACKHMVDRSLNGDRGGSLIGVSSLTATEGAAQNEAYAATKGAVMALMKSLAVEYARHGVRANSLHPGWFKTQLAGDAYESAQFQTKILPRIPARRWGSPEDLSGIAVYLASDASAYHSGDALIIDGGYSIF